MNTNGLVKQFTAAIIMGLVATISLNVAAAPPPPTKVTAAWAGGTLNPGGTIYYRAQVTTPTNGTVVVSGSIAAVGWKASFANINVPANGTTQFVTSGNLPIPAKFKGTATLTVSASLAGKKLSSKAVLVTVVVGSAAAPQPTIYDAGFDTLVTLDASIADTSKLGPARTYVWSQISGPARTLSSTTVAQPTFTTHSITNILPAEAYRFGIANTYRRLYFTNSVSGDPYTLLTYTNAVVDSSSGAVVSNNVLFTTVTWLTVTTNYDTATNNYYNIPRGYTYRQYTNMYPVTSVGVFVGYGNRERPEPETVGINEEEVLAATYKFQVVISDGAKTATATQTVVVCSSAPGQKDLPIGIKTYLQSVGTTNFVTGSPGTNGWSLLSFPVGSLLTGLGNTNSVAPYLQPDVEGVYVLSNSVTRSTLAVTGSKYVGSATCAGCHGGPSEPFYGIATALNNGVPLRDMATPWSATKHATKFQRMLDGQQGTSNFREGPAYVEACIRCHTVGYNKTPATSGNGGFDDVASDLGWTMPTRLKLGNWNDVPSQLQDKSGIQCENCHGPGSGHPGEKSKSLEVTVCGTCHQDGLFHRKLDQWEVSPHEATEEIGFNSPATNPTLCAKCHSPGGFIDFTRGIFPWRTGLGSHSCQTCHDPHNEKGFPVEAKQLRMYDTVQFGDGSVVNGLGKSALCLFCHNGRSMALTSRLTGPTNPPIWKPYYYSSSTHDSPVAEIFLGRGCVEHGQVMGTSGHKFVAECSDCHMAPGPVGDDLDKLGGHTFRTAYVDDVGVKHENVGACNTCHSGGKPVSAFNNAAPTDTGFDFKFDAAGNYDGNNTANGIQTEVKGLLCQITNQLARAAVIGTSTNSIWVDTGGNPQVLFNGFKNLNKPGPYTNLSGSMVLTEPVNAAVWNYLVVRRDNSYGVHNPKYVVKLLQHTYSYLRAWNDTPLVGWTGQTYTNYFPNAKLP